MTSEEDKMRSDTYEQMQLTRKRNRLFGNALLVTLPVIGLGNYVIANEEVTSPYVWGSAIAGASLKLCTVALDKFGDKVIQTPIEKHFMNKFSNEDNST